MKPLDITEGYSTFCEGVISSTGTPVIIRLTQIKESQTKKMVQESKKRVRSIIVNE